MSKNAANTNKADKKIPEGNFPPGRTFTIPPKFSAPIDPASDILYLHVLYDIVSGQPEFDGYGTDSGTFSSYPGGIAQFVKDRVAGTHPPTDNFTPVNPDGAVIDHTVYVVFMIDGPQSLRMNSAVVVTNDGRTGETATPDYQNLVLGLDDGTTCNSNEPVPVGSKSHLVYFEAPIAPSPWASEDDFNIYLNDFDVPIDPELRNTGHPPHMIATEELAPNDQQKTA